MLRNLTLTISVQSAGIDSSFTTRHRVVSIYRNVFSPNFVSNRNRSMMYPKLAYSRKSSQLI